MNWLITGGCGFIGRNLVKNLVDEGGHYIRIIDNLSVGTRKDLKCVCEFTESKMPFQGELNKFGIELIVADILDEDMAVKATEGMDVVIHLAANTGVGPSVQDPRHDCKNNVLGTLNYLEAARKNSIEKFIFASSGAPAGECEPPIHEEIAPHPVSPYGASKLAGEGYCSAYFHTFGINTICLRFGNVYGPYSQSKDSVVAKFIRRIEENKSLEIYGDGKQTRDFIFIDDLVSAIRLSVRKNGIGGEIFQIATSNETTVLEIVDMLVQIYRDIEKDKDILIGHSTPRKGDVKRNFSDTSKAEKLLKWKAETSLEKGLKTTVRWFRKL